MKSHLEKFLLINLANTVFLRRITSQWSTVSLLVSPTVFCGVFIVLQRGQLHNKRQNRITEIGRVDNKHFRKSRG